MRCTIVWKEAWLRRAEANEPESSLRSAGASRNALVRAGRRRTSPATSSDPLYVCQATQLPAATKPLPWWKPDQYLEDYRSGNVSALRHRCPTDLLALRGAGRHRRGARLAVSLDLQSNPIRARRRALPRAPRDICRRRPDTSVNLGLKEGELVRVKSGDEILATVDELLVNRGMGFHPEMMPIAAKRFVSTQRVQKLINEKTGQLVELKDPVPRAGRRRLCRAATRDRSTVPRACPPYWREIWLERAEAPAAPSPGQAGDHDDQLRRLAGRQRPDMHAFRFGSSSAGRVSGRAGTDPDSGCHRPPARARALSRATPSPCGPRAAQRSRSSTPCARQHLLGVRKPEGIEHDLNAMQPVMPERRLAHVVCRAARSPLGIGVEIREDAADIGRIERQVNDASGQSNCLLNWSLRGASPSITVPAAAPYVEPRRDLVAPRRELGSIDEAAIGDEVAAVLEQCRQQPAMLVRDCRRETCGS